MFGRTMFTGEKVAPRTRTLRRPAGLAVLLLSTTALTAMVSSAQAADTTWTGDLSSDWFTAGNWTAGVPTGADEVTIDPVTDIPVLIDGGPASADDIYVGHSNSGELVIGNGGTLTNSGLGQVGFTAGSMGSVTITGPGSVWDVSGDLLGVGGGGTGQIDIQLGGLLDSVSATLGYFPSGIGGVKVESAGSVWTDTGTLTIAKGGSATLDITNGGVVNSALTYIGNDPSGLGIVRVDGAGSAWNVSGDFFVGLNGRATVSVSNGATIDVGGGSGSVSIGGTVSSLIIGSTPVVAAVAPGALNAAEVMIGATSNLTFNHIGADYAFDPNISGSGSIYHRWGTTNLNGDASAFTGTTDIFGGSLYVNNLLGGVVNVGNGTLGGSGTLTGPVTIGSGGTLAPGNSIGIINVADLTLEAGSTYEVELNDSGNIAGTNNDIISATGPVTINGGTVYVTPENGTDDGGSYIAGTTYHIIHSTDMVTGTFDAVTDSYAFLNFALNYDLNNVFLTSSVATSFCLTDMTVNQCAAGDGVFSMGAGDVFDAVLTLSDVEATAALDQLSGELHASIGTALLEDSRFAREAAVNRLRQAFGMPGADAGAWAHAFGSMAQWESDGNAAAMDRDVGGLFVGGDTPIGADLLLGLLGGYSRSQIGIDDRGASSTVDTYTLGAYGGGEWDGLAVRGGASYSWHSIETARTVDFTGFSDSLSASYGAHTLQAFGEAAYGIEAGPTRFEPFANLAYVSTATDGFTEAGGGAALTSAGDTVGATFATLGMRADATVTLGEVDVSWNGMLGWRHGFGDVPEATLAFAAGGDAFTVAGVPIAADTLVLEAGIDLQLRDDARLGLEYGGHFGSSLSEHSAKASFGVRF